MGREGGTPRSLQARGAVTLKGCESAGQMLLGLCSPGLLCLLLNAALQSGPVGCKGVYSQFMILNAALESGPMGCKGIYSPFLLLNAALESDPMAFKGLCYIRELQRGLLPISVPKYSTGVRPRVLQRTLLHHRAAKGFIPHFCS